MSDVLDFLHESLHALRADRKVNRPRSDVRTLVSGLRFFCARAGLPAFSQIMSSPATHASSQNVSQGTERREAAPLPLAAVVAFESRVCDPDCPLPERLLLGGFLACIWASLRFGDAQRCAPGLVTVESGVVRGLCWRTKTSQSGQPWGCLAGGVSGEAPSGWASVWAQDLEAFVEGAPAGALPDFLVPEVFTPGRGPQRPIYRPMAYSRALSALRACLQQPWMGEGRLTAASSRVYTLHGLKTTVLSWARQLGLSEELRREQGHHRVGAGSASTRLYSRDDVWGPLFLQGRLVAAMREGWRPLRPQARGALPPAVEAPVTLPSSEVVLPPRPSQAASEPGDDSTSGSSVDASDASTHESADSSAPESAVGLPEDRILLNRLSMRFHAARPCAPGPPSRRRLVLPDGCWGAACGALLSQAAESYQVTIVAPAGALPCGRAACARALVGVPRRLPEDPDASSDE